MKVVIVGGGTAGLISAITLLTQCDEVEVTVIRSSEIGHIMVGEGTVGSTPAFFHNVLEISQEDFYKHVKPTWKLGVRFLWGERPYFDYTFTNQLSNQLFPNTNQPLGQFFHHQEWGGISSISECMSQNKLPFDKDANSVKALPKAAAYHFENQAFVDYLEKHFAAKGGKIIEGKVVTAQTSDKGIESVTLESGQIFNADFFVDASGFRGELIHKHLEEPYVSMRDHLFCDRAIVGGWERQADEPIKPYTTAETMNAGWCWQIEHERVINRGYVHCSAYISEDEAVNEFKLKNPRIADFRVVPFETRRIRQAWVKNVVAIGNACGFVEPLEATNIQVICNHSLLLAESINLGLDNPAVIQHYNQTVEAEWLNIRDFLALHYRFNNRQKTDFWNMAVNKTPLGGLNEFVDFYQKTGSFSLGSQLLPKVDRFSLEGYLVMLLGMRVAWQGCDQFNKLSGELKRAMKIFKQGNFLKASLGVPSEELIERMRSDSWQWDD